MLNKNKKTPEEAAAELRARVSELEEEIRYLKADLIHDSLTGLKTRAFFNEEARIFFDAVVKRHHGQRKEWFSFRHLSFIFFDIDHFKNINDTHGHFVGDGVLKSVAKKIMEGVRTGDVAARWGGEEIVVALVGATETNAASKADDIRKDIERLAFNNLPGMQVTISAGVASAEANTTFEEVLDRADKALYEAKESGRNRVVTWSEISG